MPFSPFIIRLYDALWAALQAGMSPQLAALGAAELPASAFMVGDPGAFASEAVALVYLGTKRERQAHDWRETTPRFELHLFALGTTTADLERRVMQLESASLGVLDADPTLGGLLKTIAVGDSEPVALKLRAGAMIHAVGFVVSCEPALRAHRPELALTEPSA